jgi:mono/diheme cytochrome c family protein
MSRVLLTAAFVLAATAASAQQAGPFPAGPGHDIVAVVCTQCHNAQPITQLRMSDAAWRRQVQNMILHGAQVGPDELDTVSAYLAEHFGPGVPFPNQTNVSVKLQPGAAAPLVEGGCALCHGLDRVIDAKRPPEQWPAIVHRMVEFGAPLDDSQASQVVDYLKANYAPAAR